MNDDFINLPVNNHYSMGDTHFLQTRNLLLNRNAPVNVVSDALSLSKLVNGVLLVVKEDYTTHPNIETAISKYKLVDGKILGFVLNATIASQGMKSKSDYYENYND